MCRSLKRQLAAPRRRGALRWCAAALRVRCSGVSAYHVMAACHTAAACRTEAACRTAEVFALRRHAARGCVLLDGKLLGPCGRHLKHLCWAGAACFTARTDTEETALLCDAVLLFAAAEGLACMA